MQEIIRQLLAELGEDPSREGLLDTPKRVEKSLHFLTSGYAADVDAVLNNALFTVDYNEMVIVKDIDFYSLCEHHLLPFFGKCHVAYIPQGRVIGLSKIPRLVDIFARRLQVQERLTNQIAETIREKIRPLGVAVVMEASHLCMSMRGVEKQNSVAVTSAMLGVFQHDARTRMEFLDLIKLPTHGRSLREDVSLLRSGPQVPAAGCTST
jgi:GTP cyclohydrolase IA